MYFLNNHNLLNFQRIYKWHGGTAQLLALLPHSKKVMGSIPAWGAVGSGGQVLPRVHRWAISQAFLCRVCMFSPCSQGVSSTKNPNSKTCKITELMSIPDQRWTVHFTWSPGAAKLPTAPGGSLRKDGPGWGKSRKQIHRDLRRTGVRACVRACVRASCRVCLPA